MGEMRIVNIQDTLLKADLVQRLQEALLTQARMTQSESTPLGMEQTRRAVETLTEGQETSQTRIREEEQGRREPFLGRRQKREGSGGEQDEAEQEQQARPGDEGGIIDVKA